MFDVSCVGEVTDGTGTTGSAEHKSFDVAGETDIAAVIAVGRSKQ
jgi:hypothetical protein